MTAQKIIPALLYLLVLAASTLHLYLTPEYDIDMLGYMGNALLEQETDPVRIHQKVYVEVAKLPRTVQQHFKGEQAGAPDSQNVSRRDRAVNAYHFAEFLPFFAIRPLYNQLLWLLSKTGMSLIRASVLVSVSSYFLLGVLLFVWVARYIEGLWAALFAILIMLSPPITQVARFTGADCVSTLFALLSLYLIWERRLLAPGIGLLLVSIYIRTDNVALAVPVVLASVWQRTIAPWKAAVLLVVAIGSVLLVNHFAGDYGLRMLYYRNFIGTPIAPAETTASFSLLDYRAAFRKGIADALAGVLLPFLIAGTIGFLRCKRLRSFAIVTLAYAFLHFVLLPNWQDRWFAVLYLACGILAASAAGIPATETSPC